MGAGRFLPWRRGRSGAAVEHTRPEVRRHVVSLAVEPGAVPRAREAAAARLAQAGVEPSSAFADAVLLVVSELVANVVRHAHDSPVAEVGITVGSGQLVVSVDDTDPRLPDLSPEGMGPGLRTVSELAAAYDGELSVEPSLARKGKIMLVRFRIPA
ncbi:ATP-binding protein [Streptomyces sp. NPDC091371]|uniref:ATP-binding protein n=1 Tax=Streptomyces sp. NPDC091371 TaxID=3155303 RepID=UPI003427B6EE